MVQAVEQGLMAQAVEQGLMAQVASEEGAGDAGGLAGG
jgi:hypothetical protein